jgi:hypothetical protein
VISVDGEPAPHVVLARIVVQYILAVADLPRLSSYCGGRRLRAERGRTTPQFDWFANL